MYHKYIYIYIQRERDFAFEKCGERHGGARRGVGGWARVTAVGVATSEEKGGL